MHDSLAYSIPEFCRAVKIGRSTIYKEIAAGRLEVIKVGRRTLITPEAGRVWLQRLAKKADTAGDGGHEQ